MAPLTGWLAIVHSSSGEVFGSDTATTKITQTKAPPTAATPQSRWSHPPSNSNSFINVLGGILRQTHSGYSVADVDLDNVWSSRLALLPLREMVVPFDSNAAPLNVALLERIVAGDPAVSGAI